jgi:uncharacterized integral membrane protein
MSLKAIDMRYVKTFLVLLFILLILIFSFQNLEVITLSFLMWHIDLPIVFASICIFLVGAITGGILFPMLRKASPED